MCEVIQKSAKRNKWTSGFLQIYLSWRIWKVLERHLHFYWDTNL